MKTLTITLGQVKQIANELSKSYKVENRGSYFNIIDRKTNQSSIEGGKYNLVSYKFQNIVQKMILDFCNKPHSEFDWFTVGVDISNENESYWFKVYYKVIELICGFKTK